MRLAALRFPVPGLPRRPTFDRYENRGWISHWLTRGGAIALPVVVGLIGAEPRPASAQTAPGSETATVEELQQALEARDAIITDMQRRMDEMERRLTVTAPDQAAPPAEPVPPPVPAKPTLPPEPPRAAEVGAVAEAASPPAAPAPGQIEVDEAAVATALERALIQQGALLLPPGMMQVQPSFNYTRRELDAPAFLVPETERIAADEIRQNDLAAGLTLRFGLPFDSQLALSVPYRYRDTSTVTRVGLVGVSEANRDASGFGDLAVTFSKGLLRERGWRPDLFARATWDTDTGQSDDGVRFGSGFHELQASLTATKSQDPLVFVSDVSYTHSFEDGGVQPGNVAGFSLGTVLAASPETSLRFFLNQNFVRDTEFNGRDIPGSDAVVSLFSIGASSILTSRAFLDVEFGIGLTESAPDYTVTIALPIQFGL